jgi:acyl-CoA synthetase (AMP-forming)/AMP-acid ligase II
MGRLDDQPVVTDLGRDAPSSSAPVDQLRRMAEHHGGETAFVQLASRDHLTFARWDTTSNRLARGLLERGLGAGDRVLVHLDVDQLDRRLISFAAVHKAGATVVPVATRASDADLAAILGADEPTVAITSVRRRTRLDRIVHLHAGQARPLVIETDDPASWRTVLADDDTAERCAGARGAAAPTDEPEWTGRSWLVSTPSSAGAALTSVYGPMTRGMRGLFLPHFAPDVWIDAVEAWRPTTASLTPAMVRRLLDHPRLAGADLTSLRQLDTGAAPLPAGAHQRIADRLPDALVTS